MLKRLHIFLCEKNELKGHTATADTTQNTTTESGRRVHNSHTHKQKTKPAFGDRHNHGLDYRAV
jgi:hypothetical protein